MQKIHQHENERIVLGIVCKNTYINFLNSIMRPRWISNGQYVPASTGNDVILIRGVSTCTALKTNR